MGRVDEVQNAGYFSLSDEHAKELMEAQESIARDRATQLKASIDTEKNTRETADRVAALTEELKVVREDLAEERKNRAVGDKKAFRVAVASFVVAAYPLFRPVIKEIARMILALAARAVS